MNEFTRTYDLRSVPAALITLTATPAECAALAQRFDLVRIDAMQAAITMAVAAGTVVVTGRLQASIVQSCAISGDDLPVTIDEPVSLRFVPEGTPPRPDEEIELDTEELDEIPLQGGQFDLGEALAQSLALAIDPFAEGPGAAAARRKAGFAQESDFGSFASLKGLLES